MVSFFCDEEESCETNENHKENNSVQQESRAENSKYFFLYSKWKMRSGRNELSVILHVNLDNIGSWNEEIRHLEHFDEARCRLNSDRLTTRINFFTSKRSNRVVHLHIYSFFIATHIEESDRYREELPW